MKKLIHRAAVAFTIFFLFVIRLISRAQDSTTAIKVDKQEVGSWFYRNWIWVAGAIVLLIIIIAAGRKKNTRTTTTTIVKDDLGNTKRVTTTETNK